MGYVNGVAFQAGKEIYGHSSRYESYFDEIFKKMEKISQVLYEETEE